MIQYDTEKSIKYHYSFFFKVLVKRGRTRSLYKIRREIAVSMLTASEL